MKLQAEQGLVKSIQDELVANGDYVKFGEVMAEQFSLGWSGIVKNAISSSLEAGQYTKQFEAVSYTHLDVYKRQGCKFEFCGKSETAKKIVAILTGGDSHVK